MRLFSFSAVIATAVIIATPSSTLAQHTSPDNLHDVTSMDTFKHYISKPKITVVDFFATWCAPCKHFAPTFHTWPQQYPHIQFLTVDVEQNYDIAEKQRIRSMPTVKVYKDGKEIKSWSPLKIQDIIQMLDKAEIEAKEEESDTMLRHAE